MPFPPWLPGGPVAVDAVVRGGVPRAVPAVVPGAVSGAVPAVVPGAVPRAVAVAVAVLRPVRAERLEGPRAVRRILLGGERGEPRVADVAEVAHEVHHLVVAEQLVHAPPRGRRFVGEPPQEIERLAVGRAAVHDVAHDHEVGVAAGPAQRLVHETGAAQQEHERVVRAVDVANGDDPRRPGPDPRRAFARGRGDRGQARRENEADGQSEPTNGRPGTRHEGISLSLSVTPRVVDAQED